MKMDIAQMKFEDVEALVEKLRVNHVSTVIERVGDRLVLNVS